MKVATKNDKKRLVLDARTSGLNDFLMLWLFSLTLLPLLTLSFTPTRWCCSFTHFLVPHVYILFHPNPTSIVLAVPISHFPSIHMRPSLSFCLLLVTCVQIFFTVCLNSKSCYFCNCWLHSTLLGQQKNLHYRRHMHFTRKSGFLRNLQAANDSRYSNS